MKKLLKFLKDEEGIVAIEYALIAVFIAVVIVAAVKLIGTRLDVIFRAILAALQ